MDTSKHTPTPWMKADFPGSFRTFISSTDGKLLANAYHMDDGGDETAEANAALIVRAVNSHEQLVAALRGARVAIDVLMAQLIEVDPSFMPTKSAVWPQLVAINHALAAAGAA